jgi:hypothetical protein
MSSPTARDLLRKIDAMLASIEDRDATIEELHAGLRALTAVVRAFVDDGDGLGRVVSNEQMRDCYYTLIRLAQDNDSTLIMPKRGVDPTPEQQMLGTLSLQMSSLTMLVFGILARTGIVRDIGLTAEEDANKRP